MTLVKPLLTPPAIILVGIEGSAVVDLVPDRPPDTTVVGMEGAKADNDVVAGAKAVVLGRVVVAGSAVVATLDAAFLAYVGAAVVTPGAYIVTGAVEYPE
jgi:hypothetical protein